MAAVGGKGKMTPKERNEFLYDTRVLSPANRREMAIEFMAKAQALLEQELIIDAMYSQMDFKAMHSWETDIYKRGIALLSEANRVLERL